MKTIIAGGRNYHLTGADMVYLDGMRETLPITEVVSGRCSTGADAGGEFWAKTRGVPVKPFPAKWKKFGKAAGPIRNGEMAEYGGALIAFPGGSGTADMVKQAAEKDLTVIIVSISDG